MLKPRAAYFALLSRERREARRRAARAEPIRFRAMLADAGKFAQAPFALSLDEDALADLQGSRCYLCAGPMDARGSRDHVWPKSHGGTFVGNKLLAHGKCNQAKGDRRPSPCELLYRDVLYEIASTPAARR